jgi:hypothetical protein
MSATSTKPLNRALSDRPSAFVSYAREDRPFVLRLADGLARKGIEAIGDWQLVSGEDYATRLRSLILRADAFVFVVTPESVTSVECRRELEMAVGLKKRILPVSRRPHGSDDLLDSALRMPQWTFFGETDDFESALQMLSDAVVTNFDLVDLHSRLLVVTDNWIAGGRSRGYLLRGESLKSAELWLARTGGRPDALPHPTPQQLEFILASRNHRTRQARMLVGIALLVAVITAALASVAFLQRNRAEQNRVEAERNRSLAEEQRHVARGLSAVAGETADDEFTGGGAPRPGNLRFMMSARTATRVCRFASDACPRDANRSLRHRGSGDVRPVGVRLSRA